MVVKEVLQKSPEGEEQTGQPSDVDKDQLRATSETDPHTNVREVAKELKVEHSMVPWHLSKLERSQSSKVGVS